MLSNSSLEHINWISKTRVPYYREEPQKVQAHVPKVEESGEGDVIL